MSKTILVKIGSRYFKVRVNPDPSVYQITKHINHLRDLQHSVKRGSDEHHKLGELIVLERERLARKLKRNPRSRILWFLVAGKHWITATAKDGETVSDALRRCYQSSSGFAQTNIQVTKPDGWTPNEWRGAIHHHAVYKPQHTARTNPLLASPHKSAVGKNIAYLMSHPEELTAKTPEMRRKQAIAIALSTWRKAAGKKRRR